MKYKLSAIFIITVFVIFVFISSTVVSALPKGPLSFSKNTEYFLSTLIYQGWGFFSKDPRDPMLNAISLEDENEIMWPHNRAKNFFGLKRTGRKQGIELGAFVSNIPEDDFQECRGDLKKCADNIKDEDIIIVENENPRPDLCGIWAVAYEEHLPWSWGKSKDEVEMPSRVVKVEILCSEN